MTESCGCSEQELLVGMLYDDIEPEQRARLERHLAGCEACRAELDALRGVRQQLTSWSPPGDDFDLEVVPARETRGIRGWPAWGLAAAAILVLAAGAAIANVELRITGDGVVVRTGWAAPAPAGAAGVRPSESWRAELAALEDRLRAEIAADHEVALAASRAAEAASETASDAAIARRVRSLLAQSEAKQQRELALRMAQLTRELDAQRRDDLVRIERGFGQLEGTAGAEVARQRELLNYLVRVSQRR